MISASNFQQAVDLEVVHTCSCGPAALWLGLLRRMRLRPTIDALCPTESPLSHGAIVEVLVLNRLLSPKPLVHVGRWVADTGLDVLLGIDPALLNDDRIGRTLDALAEVIPDAQATVSTHVVRAFDVLVEDVQYDTTATYLEGDYDDSELAARGHSKDHRPGHKQVKLALATSMDGQIPLSHLALPGNTGDVVTVPAALAALRALWPTTPVVISGDGVMWSEENRDGVARAQGVFLGPIAMNAAVVRWVCGAEPDVEVLVQLTSQHKPVRYLAQVVDRFAVNGVADAGAHLAVFDPRRAVEEREERAQALIRYDAALNDLVPRLNQGRLRKRVDLDKRLAGLAKRHGLAARFVDVSVEGDVGAFAVTWKRKEQELAATLRRDGRWPLVTNRAGLTDEELCRWAVQRYKLHGRIERDMHLLKGPLRLRPIFVQSDDRIRALICVCVWALTAWTLLERQGRKALPMQKKNVVPIRVRLESLVSMLAIVTYRLGDGSPLRRTVTKLPSRVASELRELGWMRELRELLDVAGSQPPS